MRMEARDAIRVSIALIATGATARYLWAWFFPRKQEKALAGGPAVSAAKQVVANGKEGAGAEADADTLWIYFGSQSGTAEGFAKELEQDAAGRDIRAVAVDLEDFVPEEFVKHKAVVLVVATYGEGDPTDNAMEFFKWLQTQDLPAETLQGVRYTIMGCGNRQYVHFNGVAKIADREMTRLGAECIYERGEGDDDQNIVEDFEQWKENGLWPALQKAIHGDATMATEGGGSEGGLESAEAVLKRLPLQAEVRANTQDLPVDPRVHTGGADVLGKWYFSASEAPVVECRELRQVADPEAGRTTKHIDLSTEKLPALDWKTADNLEVLPRNPDDLVEWFAERLGAGQLLDEHLGFTRAGVGSDNKPVKKPFPTPCLVRDALGLFCDLAAAPARRAALTLAAFARGEEERKVLEALLQDRETYQWLTGEDVRLSLREFFELFLPSAELDLNAFLQLCPRQKNRPYTIASSSREDKHRVGICVSMVQDEGLPSLESVLEGLRSRGHNAAGEAAQARLSSLAGGLEEAKRPRRFRGSCTSMLCHRVSEGERLWIASRPSSFRLPRRTTTPVIMLGAGTGVAPFRAFGREFLAEGAKRRKTMLFFGCQKSNEDFLYREEFEGALAADPPHLAELVTAFSREQAEKVYVQHRLKEQAEKVKEFVKDGGHIYVCGAVAMGRSVKEELVGILGSDDYVQRLQTEGLYVEELW